MIQYHQNNLSDTGEFIISHSNLCKIDPILGGHPKIFYKAMTEPKEEDTKPSFERGDLMHLWIQKQGSFVIADLDKPTEKLADFSDEFYNLYCKEQWKNNQVFEEYAKNPAPVQIEDFMTYKQLFKILHNGEEGSKEAVSLLVACVRFAREEAEYNKNLKEATMLTHFAKCVEYINFLRKADGRVVLTPATRDILTNCYQSLREHPTANALLFEAEGNHEQEYFWSRQVQDTNINRKAKLDIERVDWTNKMLTIIDLKTSAFPVSTFVSAEGGYNKYKTGRQLVSYADAFFSNDKKLNAADWKINLINVVVGTIDPYPTMVFKVDNMSQFHLSQELRSLESRVAYHIRHNQWNMSMEECMDKDNMITVK